MTKDIGLAAKKRSQSIDMVKGLSIMTLFYLHFENGWMDVSYNYFLVRSPAFYLVVGWLWGMSSNKRTIKQHWEKRKKGLVIPYLWLSLIFLVFDFMMVLLKQFDSFILYRDIYKTVCLRGIGTLWFLPALLGGEILFLFLRDRSWFIKVLGLISCFSIILLYSYWFSNFSSKEYYVKELINAPFRVVQDLSNAFIYITFAYYFSSEYGKRIFNASKIKLFFWGIILLVLSFCIMNFMLYNLDIIFYNLLFIISGICSGIGILIFFKSIENIKIIEKPLSYCGRNSLTIMAFHYCFLFPIAMSIDRNIFGYSQFYGERTIIYFLFAVFFQILIIELVNRKLKFIIGK